MKRNPNTLRRVLTTLAVVVVVALAAAIALRLTGAGERLFYYPSRAAFETPAGAVDVTFASDGRELHGWFIPAVGARSGEPRPAIVHPHGNAGNIENHAPFIAFLPAEGFHVFIFDYRSYGRSERGPLKREGLIPDTLAAIDAVADRPEVDPQRLGLLGQSLGGAVGLVAASRDDRIRAVAGAAPFSSWPGVAGDHFGPIGRFLIQGGSAARDAVAHFGDRPLLLVHGDDDAIVPHRHGEILRDAAESAGIDVTLKTIEGAGHNDLLLDPRAQDVVARFFRRELAGREPLRP